MYDESTIVYTGPVFTRYQKNTAMLNWSPCIQTHQKVMEGGMRTGGEKEGKEIGNTDSELLIVRKV